jgi:hypothetical protein
MAGPRNGAAALNELSFCTDSRRLGSRAHLQHTHGRTSLGGGKHVGDDPTDGQLGSMPQVILGRNPPRVCQTTTSKHACKEPQDQQSLEIVGSATCGIERCEGDKGEKEDAPVE